MTSQPSSGVRTVRFDTAYCIAVQSLCALDLCVSQACFRPFPIFGTMMPADPVKSVDSPETIPQLREAAELYGYNRITGFPSSFEMARFR
jgi:hypothetical protein